MMATKEGQAGGYACPAAMKSMPTQSSWRPPHTPGGRCSLKACQSYHHSWLQSNTPRWTWWLAPSTGNKFVIHWMVLDSWFLGEKDGERFERSGIHLYSLRRLQRQR